MTAHQGTVLLSLFICVWAVGSHAMTWLLFEQYCTRIAEKEGRMAERRSLCRGEMGVNPFEREQIGKLLGRRYLSLDDPALSALGDRLLTWSAGGLLSTLALIACVVLFVP